MKVPIRLIAIFVLFEVHLASTEGNLRALGVSKQNIKTSKKESKKSSKRGNKSSEDRSNVDSHDDPVVETSPSTSNPTSATTSAPTQLERQGSESPMLSINFTSNPSPFPSVATSMETKDPTKSPTSSPSPSPTVKPTVSSSTDSPSPSPSSLPTLYPTLLRVENDQGDPIDPSSSSPSDKPSLVPQTTKPTQSPSDAPSRETDRPTASPSVRPSLSPETPLPTTFPTALHSMPPSRETDRPTASPSGRPSLSPETPLPTTFPTALHSMPPTHVPTDMPTILSVIGSRLASYSLHGGSEFEDIMSYQRRALQRVEEQEGITLMTDQKIIQYYVLYCIYYSTNGESWNVRDGWIQNDLDPCKGWKGIQCDTDGKILNINLFANGLSGVFAPEVTLLASDGVYSTLAGNLQSLDLYHNELLSNDGDNSWITNLGSNLKYLFVGKTSFSGQIPRLPIGLIEFDASHTLIDGGLIASNFEGLDYLTWLLLDGCIFDSPIPTEMALLPNLQYLYTSDSMITGDLSYLKGMPAIFEHFAHDNPKLGGELYSFIGSLHTLASLNVGNCNITGTIPPSLGNLESMQQMWLNDNNLTGEIPTELGILFAMETFEIQGNNVSGSMPEAICGLGDYGSLNKLGADCHEVFCVCCNCCSSESCENFGRI